MPATKFKCPEKGCHKVTEVWVPNYPQHATEHEADAACPKHKAKYAKLRAEHVKECELRGMRP